MHMEPLRNKEVKAFSSETEQAGLHLPFSLTDADTE